ncbi:MAG: hypothetical protein LBL94_00765, partial [Prevotellaceae bacterium]|nr:hypothetical protein [Prevotellaceae bacterium]
MTKALKSLALEKFGDAHIPIDMKIYFARRAFMSIEQRIGKFALLPVGHSSLSYESPYGDKRKAIHIFLLIW